MKPQRHAGTPPPESPVTVRITSTPDEGELFVRFITEVIGINTHRLKLGKKSEPRGCKGKRDCEPSLHRSATTWYGFAAGAFYRPHPFNDWCRTVIQVTNSFWNDISKFEMAGTEWRIFKGIGESGHREMKGEMQGDVPPEEQLDAFEIRPCVERVHKTPGIEWGVLPLIPPSPVLMPVKGTMPAALALRAEQAKQKAVPADGKSASQILKEFLASQKNGKAVDQ